ncbi:NAD(P)H-quinone dehydrogenase [Citricoccus muralis]|uniref:NAD(P)H-quinone dehydrogenase n=1 Tax=Citricoccus muralis TaxID=169134 RepID=A0ABY8H8I0_9MICC|nr:NAD(P)H-quinone dehydrogenase [Citricoccus muralis]WFP17450.1 NAD(P)H-quinone dehydrogenase [Citricoccus muralis]
MSPLENVQRPSLTIVGGGPGGYEAALVAAKLGATVTVVERAGLGGAAVLTDVVPSKTLIATADSRRRVMKAPALGVKLDTEAIQTDIQAIDRRLLQLASDQSRDIRTALERRGVKIIIGEAKLTSDKTVAVTTPEGTETVTSDAILLATGASPRELPTAMPDGQRIFNWKQVYNLTELPEHMIVVGSGVTGAEFASAYNLLGAKVSLVSSRDQVLPNEDPDAARVLEDVFTRNGVNVVSRTRANAVTRTENGVQVELSTGEILEGSHCLLAVGGVPNTQNIGLEEVGVQLTESGHIATDSVSRTSVPGIYAAGDCTGVFALASVAAMQGRVAVAHLMGDAVQPIKHHLVASNIFTSPEIATVGLTDAQARSDQYQVDEIKMDLTTNPRAKMADVSEGFVKIFARKGSGTVVGGVIVAPRASELIYALALAVTHKLHVDDLANTFTVYPSLSGSVAEAARRLHVRG